MCAWVALVAVTVMAKEEPSAITVFTAKKIVTMDPTRPTATAVAVRDGMILGVGSLQDLAPWLKDKQYKVDSQFKDKVLMPGLIDSHMHPMLGAIAFHARVTTSSIDHWIFQHSAINQRLDICEDVPGQTGRDAPIVKDSTLIPVLAAGHKYAGSKTLFQPHCQPANEAAVVGAWRKVEAEYTEQLLPQVFARNELTPHLVIPNESQCVGVRRVGKRRQGEFQRRIGAGKESDARLGGKAPPSIPGNSWIMIVSAPVFRSNV
jgi:hypothetical protein